MVSEKERKFAYCFAAVLFAVGVICYTAFSAQKPDEPVRLMYENVGGNVMFDHKVHSGESGYVDSCYACHHHPEENEDAIKACTDCHTLPEDGSLPALCMDCHEEGEVDTGNMKKSRMDTYHLQCAGCHETEEAGPGPDDCKACHLKY